MAVKRFVAFNLWCDEPKYIYTTIDNKLCAKN